MEGHVPGRAAAGGDVSDRLEPVVAEGEHGDGVVAPAGRVHVAAVGGDPGHVLPPTLRHPPHHALQGGVEALNDATRPGRKKTIPEDKIEEMTAAATAFIERQIRAHPEQWVWIHRRWKTRPEDNPQR